MQSVHLFKPSSAIGLRGTQHADPLKTPSMMLVMVFVEHLVSHLLLDLLTVDPKSGQESD